MLLDLSGYQTACGQCVVLPGGISLTRPDCPECLEALT